MWFVHFKRMWSSNVFWCDPVSGSIFQVTHNSQPLVIIFTVVADDESIMLRYCIAIGLVICNFIKEQLIVAIFINLCQCIFRNDVSCQCFSVVINEFYPMCLCTHEWIVVFLPHWDTIFICHSLFNHSLMTFHMIWCSRASCIWWCNHTSWTQHVIHEVWRKMRCKVPCIRSLKTKWKHQSSTLGSHNNRVNLRWKTSIVEFKSFECAQQHLQQIISFCSHMWSWCELLTETTKLWEGRLAVMSDHSQWKGRLGVATNHKWRCWLVWINRICWDTIIQPTTGTGSNELETSARSKKKKEKEKHFYENFLNECLCTIVLKVCNAIHQWLHENWVKNVLCIWVKWTLQWSLMFWNMPQCKYSEQAIWLVERRHHRWKLELKNATSNKGVNFWMFCAISVLFSFLSSFFLPFSFSSFLGERCKLLHQHDTKTVQSSPMMIIKEIIF